MIWWNDDYGEGYRLTLSRLLFHDCLVVVHSNSFPVLNSTGCLLCGYSRSCRLYGLRVSSSSLLAIAMIYDAFIGVGHTVLKIDASVFPT